MSSRRFRVADSSQLPEGTLLSARAGAQRILVSRVKGRVYAVVDRCPHMGMSLAKGKLEGGIVTCPWHNSRFDLCTGKNMDWVSALLGIRMPGWTHNMIAMGKRPAPLKTLQVEESDGQVFVTA